MMQENRLKRPKDVGEIKKLLQQLFAATSNNEETKVSSSTQAQANLVSNEEETVWAVKADQTKSEEDKHSSVNTSKAVMGKRRKILLSIFCFSFLFSAIYLVYAKVHRDKVIANIANNMVEINKAGTKYSINKYEVTQEEWEAVMGSTPSYFKGANLPVENVSWYDCQKFIKKLNEKTGRNFRLPTTAEWKSAASFGFPIFVDPRCRWTSWNSGGRTHSVASWSSNDFGLFDMLGNVLEWTEEKDLCGGSYKSTDVSYYIDSPTYRNVNPWSCDSFIGFRLAE